MSTFHINNAETLLMKFANTFLWILWEHFDRIEVMTENLSSKQFNNWFIEFDPTSFLPHCVWLATNFASGELHMAKK